MFNINEMTQVTITDDIGTQLFDQTQHKLQAMVYSNVEKIIESYPIYGGSINYDTTLWETQTMELIFRLSQDNLKEFSLFVSKPVRFIISFEINGVTRNIKGIFQSIENSLMCTPYVEMRTVFVLDIPPYQLIVGSISTQSITGSNYDTSNYNSAVYGNQASSGSAFFTLTSNIGFIDLVGIGNGTPITLNIGSNVINFNSVPSGQTFRYCNVPNSYAVQINNNDSVSSIIVNQSNIFRGINDTNVTLSVAGLTNVQYTVYDCSVILC